MQYTLDLLHNEEILLYLISTLFQTQDSAQCMATPYSLPSPGKSTPASQKAALPCSRSNTMQPLREQELRLGKLNLHSMQSFSSASVPTSSTQCQIDVGQGTYIT